MNLSNFFFAFVYIITSIGLFVYGFFAVFRTRQLIDYYIRSHRKSYLQRWGLFKRLAERNERMYKTDLHTLKVRLIGILIILFSLLYLIVAIHTIINQLNS